MHTHVWSATITPDQDDLDFASATVARLRRLPNTTAPEVKQFSWGLGEVWADGDVLAEGHVVLSVEFPETK